MTYDSSNLISASSNIGRFVPLIVHLGDFR